MQVRNKKAEVAVWCCTKGADPEKTGYLYARFHLSCHAREWAEDLAKQCYTTEEMVMVDTGRIIDRFPGKKVYQDG